MVRPFKIRRPKRVKRFSKAFRARRPRRVKIWHRFFTVRKGSRYISPSIKSKTRLPSTSPTPPRYFTTFDASIGSHISLPEITLPGDFEVEIKFVVFGNDDLTLVSGSQQSSNTIVMDVVDEDIRAFAYAGATLQPIILIPVAPYQDGKLHTLKLTVYSGAVKVYIDNVLKMSDNWSLTGNENIALIGTRPTLGRYFDGVLADVKITGGEISGSPTDIFYPLDEDWNGSTVVNNTPDPIGDGAAVNIAAAESEEFEWVKGAWLGAELTDQTEAMLPSEYIDIFNYWDICVVTHELRYRLMTVILVDVYASLSGWSLQGGVPSTPDFRITDTTESANLEGIYIPDTDSTIRLFSTVGDTADFTNISVKRILEVAP